MGATTKIEWSQSTWSPVRARLKEDLRIMTKGGALRVIPAGKVGWHCERVSPGCVNCYAETLNERGLPGCGTGLGFTVPNREQVDIILDEKLLLQPLRWSKGRKIFTNSMTDTFGEFVPDEMIDRIFAVAAMCPQHTFQILTKRAQRMHDYFRSPVDLLRVRWAEALLDPHVFPGDPRRAVVLGNPSRAGVAEGLMKGWRSLQLPNVWLGVSVETQVYADARIPLLLNTPAAVRFVSYEPALGPVDFTRVDYRKQLRDTLVEAVRWSAERHGEKDIEEQVLKAAASVPEGELGDLTPRLNVLTGEWFDGWDSGTDGQKLDWIIIGGESGHGARPFSIQWARNTIDQCGSTGVAVFLKQLGAVPVIGDEETLDGWANHVERDLHREPIGSRIRLADKKGGDWEEWPERLRVREFPEDRPLAN